VKPRNSVETTLICVIGAVIAIAVIVTGAVQASVQGSAKAVVWVFVAGVLGLGIVAWARAFGARKTVKAELTSGEQYRRLADEYRRLADMAITAQEHTDLKLGDVSVRIDDLREQVGSLQKILKEVE
jgi:threonine dehydrogenase-like Zn-dependent dehydrogenase